MFGIPFKQIAPIMDRTPVAARKLASRARQRVQGAAAAPDPDLAARRRVLDPDVTLRGGKALPGGMKVLHGAQALAGQVATLPAHGHHLDHELTVANEKIVAIDILSDLDRLTHPHHASTEH